MRTIACLLFCYFLATQQAFTADTLRVCSPSGKICVKVWMDKQLTYAVSYKESPLILPSFVDLAPVGKPALSASRRISRSQIKKIEATIEVPVPEKRKTICNHYTRLTLSFDAPYEVQFRVYDDGAAYRIATSFKDSLTIKDELAEFHFVEDPTAYFPEITKKDGDIFMTSFEDLYQHKKLSELPSTSIAYSPILITPSQGPKIAISESDLNDYPGMFFKGTGHSSLRGIFAPYALEDSILHAEYSQKRVAKRADYIAKTIGTRAFPWRVIIIAERDEDLPSCDLIYKLGAPSELNNNSWVKPGNITDEWIIDLNVYNVPFRAGRNTATYKYYVDFAQKFGIDWIMLDAGWSDNNNLMKVNPDINMDSLLAYARSKGVKIALWTLALTLDRQLDTALTQFNKWGIEFIMTDFIDRDDQKAVNLHHRIAKACADHKIMVMFHGTYPPKGFNRTYPNAITREAVLGSEYNIWSDKVSPDHDVLLPFTRMLAGPLDYEPGLLNNATRKSFRFVEGHVMSPGTRAHQAAMLVVYDSPIQFFSGNPSQGLKEPEFMTFWGSIPSSWEETKILQAKVGEYIVSSRKNADNWFIGAMTNWEQRDIEITFDFLEPDKVYEATICMDGINADRYAADYVIETLIIRKGDKRSFHLAPGGGLLLKMIKK